MYLFYHFTQQTFSENKKHKHENVKVCSIPRVVSQVTALTTSDRYCCLLLFNIHVYLLNVSSHLTNRLPLFLPPHIPHSDASLFTTPFLPCVVLARTIKTKPNTTDEINHTQKRYVTLRYDTTRYNAHIKSTET